MMYIDEKEFGLNMLKNSEIQDKILEIIIQRFPNLNNTGDTVSSQKVKELKETISKLEENINQLTYDNKVLSNKISTLEAENITLKDKNASLDITIKDLTTERNNLNKEKNDLINEKTELEKNISVLENQNADLNEKFIPYAKLNEMYQKYMALDINIRENLQKTIHCDTPIDFLWSISKEENIESLFEWICYHFDDKISNLIEICNWILQEYIKFNPNFRFIDTNIGEPYDNSHHLDISNANNQTIKEVLIKGYYNTLTGKTIKKSIVRT